MTKKASTFSVLSPGDFLQLQRNITIWKRVQPNDSTKDEIAGLFRMGETCMVIAFDKSDEVNNYVLIMTKNSVLAWVWLSSADPSDLLKHGYVKVLF